MRAFIAFLVLMVGSPSPVMEQTIRGRIVSVPDAYHIVVRDDKGYIDNIELHHGTIINPTGLTLAPGMEVKVLGYNAGSMFAANEIDTPYVYVPATFPRRGRSTTVRHTRCRSRERRFAGIRSSGIR